MVEGAEDASASVDPDAAADSATEIGSATGEVADNAAPTRPPTPSTIPTTRSISRSPLAGSSATGTVKRPGSSRTRGVSVLQAGRAVRRRGSGRGSPSRLASGAEPAPDTLRLAGRTVGGLRLLAAASLQQGLLGGRGWSSLFFPRLRLDGRAVSGRRLRSTARRPRSSWLRLLVRAVGRRRLRRARASGRLGVRIGIGLAFGLAGADEASGLRARGDRDRLASFFRCGWFGCSVRVAVGRPRTRRGWRHRPPRSRTRAPPRSGFGTISRPRSSNSSQPISSAPVADGRRRSSSRRDRPRPRPPRRRRRRGSPRRRRVPAVTRHLLAGGSSAASSDFAARRGRSVPDLSRAARSAPVAGRPP